VQIRAGQVDVNAAPFNPRPPFGGYKHFGIRREIADYRIDDMLKVQAVQLTVSIADRKDPTVRRQSATHASTAIFDRYLS